MTREELISIFYQYEAERIVHECQLSSTELVIGNVEIGIRIINWIYNRKEQYFVSIGGYIVEPKKS